MKQWQITDQWDLDSLKLVDADVPEPGPGDVLLKMKAVSLNFRDYLMVHHKYGSISGELPLVPLSDGVGEVVALGDGVEDIPIGSRRVPCFNQGWLQGDLEEPMWTEVLGGPLDGTARQYMCAKAVATAAVPGHVTDEEAATFCCAAITAWNALKEMPKSAKDGGIVVTQGTGGVSLFALQLAKARGARVIATSSEPEKLERLKALGADETLNYRETPDWGKEVLKMTDGQGADLVVDIGGAATIKQSIRAVRSNGAIPLIGNVGGSLAEINLPIVFMFRKRLIGISTGSAADFTDMFQELDKIKFHPVLDDKIYGFDDLKSALQTLPEGKHFGKVVVQVD
jgi:NADPH:quinone reductase-like Zn-dependent oxidoreductase